jgi:hypothetical protein
MATLSISTVVGMLIACGATETPLRWSKLLRALLAGYNRICGYPDLSHRAPNADKRGITGVLLHVHPPAGHEPDQPWQVVRDQRYHPE